MIKIKARQGRYRLVESWAGMIGLIALLMLMGGFSIAGAANCPGVGYALKANGFSGGSSKSSSASYVNKASVGLAGVVGDESTAPSGNKTKHGFWHVATSNFQGTNTPPSVTVNVPNGGETWSETQNILWTATDAEQIGAGALCATIYYGASASGPWTQITTGQACTNGVQASYPWNTTILNGTYYVRVVISDGAGSNGENVSNASFIIDNTAPNNVTNLQTSSHSSAIAQWNDPQSSDNTVDVSWTAATDSGGSGLDGYSVLWDTSPTTLPDNTKDIEQNITSATSAALTNGKTHYFHIRSVDNAGNWATGTAHIGPFYIDAAHSGKPTPVQEIP